MEGSSGIPGWSRPLKKAIRHAEPFARRSDPPSSVIPSGARNLALIVCHSEPRPCVIPSRGQVSFRVERGICFSARGKLREESAFPPGVNSAKHLLCPPENKQSKPFAEQMPPEWRRYDLLLITGKYTGAVMAGLTLLRSVRGCPRRIPGSLPQTRRRIQTVDGPRSGGSRRRCPGWRTGSQGAG